ncbi:18270_t:CDS:2 [Gigaspora rosea]|nr:18270_t:CDS:2 [Gigaspora rosea]
MASINLNVARWTALPLGVAYGLWHSNSLRKSAEKERATIKYRHKEELINKAKAAYFTPKRSSTGVVTDPNDPNFDLERLIEHYATQGAGAH